MLKVASSVEMKNIDRRTIEKYNVPGLSLMENAGRSVVEILEKIWAEIQEKEIEFTPDLRHWSGGLLNRTKVMVLCGKGNNGGDGFVVARYLVNKRAVPAIFLLGKRREIKGDARTNLENITKMGIPLIEIHNQRLLPKFQESLKESEIVIDAIFGTGFKGEITGYLARIIEMVNASEKLVIAVDLPSGLDADTGDVQSATIRADVTVTMGLLKRGLLLYPGRMHAGRTFVAEIGMPEMGVEEEKIKLSLLQDIDVAQLLPHRFPDTHKNACGIVLVVAGSVGMTGAAVLTSEAVLKAGAGLCYLGLPESLNDAMESRLTEVITKPLPQTRDRTLNLLAESEIERLMKKCDVLTIGPGLSQHSETAELVRRVVKKISGPMVIDADGLNALAGKPEIFKKITMPTVITPHPGELSRLLNTSVEEIKRDRIGKAEEAAQNLGVVVVLKGAPTVIAEPSGLSWINPTGNAGMATAGVGDVLTGVIAGMMAQGLSPLEAAQVGVYLHGLAGDIASEEKTEYSMMARDVLENIPKAIEMITSL
ncbi:MAG: NAD(P)H-hydrate dehydratase [Candidatus Edwardsbacteria bacterium]